MRRECGLVQPVIAPEENRSSGPDGVSTTLRKLGRQYLMMTAIAATTVLCLPANPALAAPRHAGRTAHSRSMPIASPHVRRVVHRHHRRAPIRINLIRAESLHAGIMHRGAVSLANTVWDNPRVPPAVLNAIRGAARSTGVDPDLLAAIAWRESRFNPAARNRQSSATGLLQFTSETWLRAVWSFGAQHDLAHFAAAIRKDRSGVFVVSDQRMRTAIMQLRSDPALSASLAAESIVQQGKALQDQLGRSATPADLYLLHVLGRNGAARFIQAVATNPSDSSLQVASFKVMRNAGLLPRDGRPLTLANTYNAVTVLLQTQQANLPPLQMADEAGRGASTAGPIEVSEMPQ
jgi:Transglycosylase SLT domain